MQVVPHYMFTLRRHKLLARLLGLLQQQVLAMYGSDSVLMLRELWELVARRDNPHYTPLLLYRMVGVGLCVFGCFASHWAVMHYFGAAAGMCSLMAADCSLDCCQQQLAVVGNWIGQHMSYCNRANSTTNQPAWVMPIGS
jgi:hypothetical protein